MLFKILRKIFRDEDFLTFGHKINVLERELEDCIEYIEKLEKDNKDLWNFNGRTFIVPISADAKWHTDEEFADYVKPYKMKEIKFWKEYVKNEQ
jgi:hypothetical protein